MIWKKWAIWYKGAIVGLIIAFIVSIGLTSNNDIWNALASPGLITCRVMAQCGNFCEPCNVVGLMINLVYGFLIGALVGWLIEKYFIKDKKNNIKKIKRRKK